MNNSHSLRKDRLRVIAVDIIMALSVVAIVGILMFITMGYSLTRDLNLEQSGLVQFGSRPTGATISINGEEISSRTNTRTMLAPGEHSIHFYRSGFGPWSKNITLSPGQVLWLNYARLFPSNPELSTIRTYQNIASVSAAPNSQFLLITFTDPNRPFHLLDLRSEEVRYREIITSGFLSGLNDPEITNHQIEIMEWSGNNNRALIRHTFADYIEWILLDLRDPSESINLTTTYRLNFSDVKIASNDGRHLFMLENNNFRRADVNNQTISAVLLDNVASFTQINRDTIIFLSVPNVNSLVNIGIYRDGERGASILYTVAYTGQNLAVTGGRHYNRDHAIIADGQNILIMRGTFPSFGRPAPAFRVWRELTVDFEILDLTLIGNSRQIIATNHDRVFNYDIETSIASYFNFRDPTSPPGESEYPEEVPAPIPARFPVRTLGPFMLYTTRGDRLIVYDFDGNNIRDITAAHDNFDVVITSNDRFLYTVVRDDDTTFRLVRMLLTVR
ncbi:PEGA domain-containing protein [Candidatus Saccharibacteria bacterium]|nr:PEGA domain-containing protein [Candidatus Saccharibacteria bacterium]